MEFGIKFKMNDINNLNTILNKTFNNITIDDLTKTNNVMNVWKKVLLRIKNYNNPYEGENLYNHSTIVDLKNGILIVEVDHPGWINILNLHKKYILNGLNLELPELKIKSIGMKLAGKKDNIFDSSENKKNIINDIEKRLKEEEKILNEIYKEDEIKEKVELPEELKQIFNNLKNDMLTNSEN